MLSFIWDRFRPDKDCSCDCPHSHARALEEMVFRLDLQVKTLQRELVRLDTELRQVKEKVPS